jgi:hypothetical protein
MSKYILDNKQIEKELENSQLSDNKFKSFISNYICSNEVLFKAQGFSGILTSFIDSSKRNWIDSTTIAKGYAVILADKKIFEAFLTTTNSRDVYLHFAQVKYVSTLKLGTLKDKDADFDCFPKVVSDWNTVIYGLPLTVRKHLLVFFDIYPKSALPSKEIPKTAYIYEGQTQIFKDLPLLTAYMMQHPLDSTANIGRVKSSEINKLKKNFSGEEFFPKAKRNLGAIRHIFLGNLFNKVPMAIRNKKQLSLLNYIFKEVYPTRKYKSAFDIFSHYKCEKYFYDTNGETEQKFIEEFKKLTPNQWYNFDDYFLNFQFDASIEPFPFYVLNDKVYDYYFSPRHIETSKIEQSEGFVHERLFNIPFLKGTLFLWASFGLMDIAYDEAVTKPEFEGDIIDDYRSLKYFKLNELGAYVLGLNPNYIPPKIETNDELFLSKDALVITTHEDNKKAKMLLQDYMNEVGENRYVTDYEKFMDKCNSLSELKKKILDFKILIGSTPPNWQIFFDEIVGKIHPVEELDGYKILKIKNDPELIRLIAKDEILKKWIIKAENFHIILLEKDIYKLKKRLRQLGYFSVI